MNRTIMFAAAATLALTTFFSAPVLAGEPNDMFIIMTSTKSPDDVQAAIKAYTLDKKWIYVNDNKLKNDEVIQVRMCIPSVGKYLWGAGLHLSSVVPCGQFGIYKKDGVTTISMLHPKFMNVLYPDPLTKKAGEEVLPLLTKMLEEVTK